MINISKNKTLILLNECIDKIDKIKTFPRFSIEFKKWRRDTEVVIEKIFGNKSRHINDFENIKYQLMMWNFRTPEQKHDDVFKNGLDEAKVILNSMVDEVNKFYSGDNLDENRKLNDSRKLPINPKDIFVVHGKDEGMKQSVARFIEKLELNAIILHEQPNKGLTIIEKFEDYSNVSFAIVLLSPDDICYKNDDSNKDIIFRARQNVIFELGFFIGKLGRRHVVTLYKPTEEFDMPSDYSGVLYIEYDSNGSWQYKIIKELISCGYNIDANKILK